MSEFKKAVQRQKQSVAYLATNAKRIASLVRTHHVEKLFNMLRGAEPNVNIDIGIHTVYIRVPVKSMKHMLEVLEVAEQVTGISFDSNSDNAQYGTRTFCSSDYNHMWLNITAQVPLQDTEGQTCRRVRTGSKVVEVDEYTLECSE